MNYLFVRKNIANTSRKYGEYRSFERLLLLPPPPPPPSPPPPPPPPPSPPPPLLLLLLLLLPDRLVGLVVKASATRGEDPMVQIPLAPGFFQGQVIPVT